MISHVSLNTCVFWLAVRQSTFPKQQQQDFDMAEPGSFTVQHLHASRRASCPARGRPSYSASRLRNLCLSVAVEDAGLGRLLFVFLGMFILRASRASGAMCVVPVLAYTLAHTHSYRRKVDLASPCRTFAYYI